MEEISDLIIRNGKIIDGSGGPEILSDILIKDGKIEKIGKISSSINVKREIDANGFIVTPGFVDIHTHYDGQATWDNFLSPSSWHGVTTALMGNCGVGFAPVHDHDHDRLISLMEGVEDIPDVVLTEGLEWNWNSFSDYLNVLDNKGFDMDIGAQIPHGALRLYVMGQRGADRESATEDDIKKMAELSAEAIENGAIGFTTSRTVFHKTSKGELVPSFDAAGNELIQIAKEIGKTGKGVLQLVSDFLGGYDEFKMLEKMYDQFLNYSLIEYEKTQLPNKYPEFKALLKEYRDGILLFDISDQMIWSKAIKDTAGLKSFYEKNKAKWKYNDRVKAEIYTCDDKKTAKKINKFLNKEISYDSIMKLINNNHLAVKLNKKTIDDFKPYATSYNDLNLGPNKPTYKNQKWVILNVIDKLPQREKYLNEAEGIIVSAYQNYLEKEWINNLRQENKIEVNYESLYSIKEKPKN